MFIVNSSQLTNKTAEDATESKYANGTHHYWNRSMLMPSPVPNRLAGTPLGSTIFSNDHPDTISSILPAYSSSFHSYIFHINTISSQYIHHHHHHHHHPHHLMHPKMSRSSVLKRCKKVMSTPNACILGSQANFRTGGEGNDAPAGANKDGTAGNNRLRKRPFLTL